MAATFMGIRTDLALQLHRPSCGLWCGVLASTAVAGWCAADVSIRQRRGGTGLGVPLLRAPRFRVFRRRLECRGRVDRADRDHRVFEQLGLGCPTHALPDLGRASCVVVVGLFAPERLTSY